MILNPPERAPNLTRAAWRHLSFHGESVWFEPNTLELRDDETTPLSTGAVPYPMASKPKAWGRPAMLVLIPTFGCNLKCTYCFAGEPADTPIMSLVTARRAIRLLDPAKITLSFFGGEPLVAFDLMREATAYAQGLAAARGRVARVHVTTNGVLIDRERAEWLVSNGYTFIVSIDGPRNLHDDYRVDRDGNGSFDRAVQGAEHVAGAGAKSMTLRGTFGPDNPRLLERVKFLNSMVRRGVGDSVSVEPSCLSESVCARGVRGFGPRDVAATAREYHKLAEWMLAEWAAGRHPKQMQIERMIRRLLDRKTSCSQCGAGNGYLTVGPCGEVYACHRAGNNTRIGSLDDYREGRASWTDNRLVNSERCTACWLKFICGGTCRKDALEMSGGLWKPSRVHCAIRFMWVREAIWIIAKATRMGIVDRLRETADKPIRAGQEGCKRPSEAKRRGDHDHCQADIKEAR